MSTIVAAVVVFALSRSAPKLSKAMHAVITAMTGNTWFASNAALVASSLTNLLTLDAAQLLAGTKALGAVPTRDEKLALVLSDGKALKSAVQRVCDENPTQAATIAESAGMRLRGQNSGQKADLAAKPSGVSGVVRLIALAIAGAGSYEWQMSLDERTWTNLTSTKKAKTTVSGLTVGTTYYFRVHGIIATGPTNWSQIVSIVVT